MKKSQGEKLENRLLFLKRRGIKDGGFFLVRTRRDGKMRWWVSGSCCCFTPINPSINIRWCVGLWRRRSWTRAPFDCRWIRRWFMNHVDRDNAPDYRVKTSSVQFFSRGRIKSVSYKKKVTLRYYSQSRICCCCCRRWMEIDNNSQTLSLSLLLLSRCTVIRTL